MERGKEGESVLQAGSSADHTRTKESLSFHGAPSWPGLWRSLSGLPLGLSGAMRLLHLLVPPGIPTAMKPSAPPAPQKAPHSSDSSSLLCVGSGGFEARSSQEVSVRRPMFSLRTWWCLRHHQGALGLLGTRGQGKVRPQRVEAPGPGAAPPCSSPLPQDLSAGDQGDSAGLSNEK